MNLDYQRAGVNSAGEEQGLARLIGWVKRTHDFRPDQTLLPIGAYANVIRVAPDIGIAISTDSVGSKVVVAQMMGRYDTVGIDCVAANVNDLLCVGAEPIALVDTIAVNTPDADALEAIAIGLCEGARQANVSIAGGEIAQLPDLIQSHGTGMAFDLGGTAIGTVHPDRVITGTELASRSEAPSPRRRCTGCSTWAWGSVWSSPRLGRLK